MVARPHAGVTLVVLLATLAVVGNAEEATPAGNHEAPPAGEWPSYRRDAGLTGFSPIRGGLQVAPLRRWGYDLGGATRPVEQVRLMDLNGDGREELLRVLKDRLICQSVEGQRLWESEALPQPQLVLVRDFAGDGTRGLLVASTNGVEHRRYLISGVSGKATFLYACANVFGRYERHGKLLADVPGEQLSAWWSGDSTTKFGGNTALGRGYLWSFEKGLEKPTRRFEAAEEGTIYAPLQLIADMNGDGAADMVMISHEAMWVYDLTSGKRLMQSSWGPSIRTYWAATAAEPLSAGELPSLLMINPFIPGVQVVTQDGTTARSKWKQVVGDMENQYQAKVKIDRGAPDPFVDLDGDGEIEILTAVTNEHADDKNHLVIFGSRTGTRLFDSADQRVITVDELDGEAPREVLLREGQDVLRICNWDGAKWVERWRGTEVDPLVTPTPPEGLLARAVGARSTGRNMPLWRDESGQKHFLLRFPDGVWACQLMKENLQRVRRVTEHEALGPTSPPPRNYAWDQGRLMVSEKGARRMTYEMPTRASYAATPPLVGRLGSQTRIVVREFSGALVSLASDGADRRVLVEKTPASLGHRIVDLDGDGENEVLGLSQTQEGAAEVNVVDAWGKQTLRVMAPEGATETALGPTGRLGTGRGRWFLARYRIPYQNTRVVAYDGASGKALWMRDYLGPERVPSTSFVLHLPTAVADFDGDGADDLIASSENWYELISVRDNRSLTANRVITAAVPGHWGAYATPLLVRQSGQRPPLVFHNNAYALSLLTKPDGTPVWHYGLTRDTTHASKAGLADLDGDGSLELVTTQQDGLLRAFDGKGAARCCPSCPPDAALTTTNHSGQVRWTKRLPPPVSDFATLDLDGDGQVELLCGAGDGYLYALKERGDRCEVLWRVALGPVAVGAPVVADLDGDGRPDILVATIDGQLHRLGPDGR